MGRAMMGRTGRLARAALLAGLGCLGAEAQTAQSAAVTRFVGSIATISGDTLAVKTDQGDVHTVQVPSTAQLKRIAPGQTDLSKAETIDFSGLAVGDRVLVNIDPNASGATPQALRVIAIKQADVAKKQQAEAAAWAQGVHGLVKSVDAASGVIQVNTRTGAVTKQVTVNTTPATTVKRYATGSVNFSDAQPAPISAIQTGDQIFVLGTKSADGTSVAAQQVVSGSFRSIPGTIVSTDVAGSTVTVKDLATKKTVTVHITADAQLRRLDDRAATMIAARLKGNQGGGAGGGGNAGDGQRSFSQNRGGGPPPGFSQAGGSGPRGNGQGGGDLESILERAQTVELSSLQKGDAVMIVATEDSTGVNAIKLLAGVEPLLEAPEAQDLLASWSLNQGTADSGQ
jgi:hypothetical protein